MTLAIHPLTAGGFGAEPERRGLPGLVGPIDHDHVGSHVGEHHRAERCRTQPSQLHNPYPVEWSCHRRAPCLVHK